MITVNDEKHEFEDGMTVELLLKKLNFVFPMLVIKINGKLIKRPAYGRTLVNDEDNVSIFHLISGG